MSEEIRCQRCGAPMGADAPEGQCPACLMRLAAAAPSREEEGETRRQERGEEEAGPRERE